MFSNELWITHGSVFGGHMIVDMSVFSFGTGSKGLRLISVEGADLNL